tara:strand:+ start:546 stop:755 length:210 start_codon:yes stop_codon:yes gene_type:complete
MSYTPKELREIAHNIEEFRYNKSIDYFYTDAKGEVKRHELTLSPTRDTQLYQMAKDLYIKANGKYTKEA